MEQHVISAWLLRSFAAHGQGGTDVLHTYDKVLDRFDEITVEAFLAETNAHSAEIEARFSVAESRAAGASRRLIKRTKRLPPGIYAVVSADAEVQVAGDTFSDMGVIENMRLFVGQHEVPSPTDADRAAISIFTALMYQRAPKLEAALEQFGRDYDAAAQPILDALETGIASESVGGINARRARMLRNAADIAPRLASAHWWVVRGLDDSPFVLGDNPVATTISLGHDDSWRGILGDQTFVVALPLSRQIALLLAPQILIPVTGIETTNDAVQAINRLEWRSAGRYVVGRSREHLDAALSGADPSLRRATIPVDYDRTRIAQAAIGNAISVVAKVRFRHQVGEWSRWVDHRATFGWTTSTAIEAEWGRTGRKPHTM